LSEPGSRAGAGGGTRLDPRPDMNVREFKSQCFGGKMAVRHGFEP
jgi:hypothetical protein